MNFVSMNFVSPFQSEREFKVNNSCKCSQVIYAVHYTNTVIQYDPWTYPFQFLCFIKLLNNLKRVYLL